VKNVKFVELGRYRMETWYYSPFPKVRHRQQASEYIRSLRKSESLPETMTSVHPCNSGTADTI
jgi:hypothetical protein